jgi:CspA family cold shock protein
MPQGTVKWFNATKGYGFIEPSDGTRDAFVHVSEVEKAGLATLNEGQKVEFDLAPGRDGKSAAENLVLLD